MRNKIIYFIRSKLLPDSLFLINGKRESKSLYLTFDDGPVQGVTEELLELLAQHKVKATFFIIGSRISKSSDLLKKIHQQKHTIANHSYSHPNFTKLSSETMLEQIITTNELIRATTQQCCRLFRAPQGRWSIRLLFKLFRLKMTAVHWSRDSMDFLKEQPEKIVKRFIDEPVKNGDIILFHDDNSRCIEALKTLIPHWHSQGFSLNALENK
ncbi:polysaccharide deacetylase family protein [Colwellia psychrerythraea]|uniref:Polysaccharide deacetylase family protein n=1 Tax=Colwellia psychrerythraea (strain 34H / ATCC BAA-681) TaxID=167879 RepID=Q47U67_COLP3|nr:polysaccharide deacetylase family protein [Colwellia psychrerythraea]AAZ25942.1 polysaccharide deacetylase family protein [Colwellia psychrerythraea 34H]